MTSLKKVFGIISYFPDNDTEYHIETRRERSRRFRELLFKLEELWPEIDILVIAQNWQDFELPKINNKIIAIHYGKLGILEARRELRRKFLQSKYDCLIMFDDDAMINSDNPQAYLDEIDAHPDGIGVIRKNQSPLQFLAISKTIYSQIDMPDIDAEKGQGFEDDIFVASCFAKFPDQAYEFPKGIVTETSFRYVGEGKCPSTWSRENQYDWNYMRNHTLSEISKFDHPELQVPEFDGEPTIDLLISYVNSSDNLWLKDFVRATKTHNPSAVRFRSWGTLKYLFRGIERYMPFIRKIVLVVARPSQVPVWVNTDKVRIVYHDEFIPEKFLPTFNSCTIESYFWNIKDLADRVIYFNDDMFPVNPMSEEDFFTGNVPHIKFTDVETYSAKQIFRSQCRASLDMITNALGLQAFPTGKIIRPYHISAAFTRETFEKIKELCADNIPSTVSRLRTLNNVNQYIYSYYNYFTDNRIDDTISYKYVDLNEKTIDTASKEILYGTNKMVCLNDSEKIKDYARVRYLIHQCFEKKFPNQSKYEL